MAVTVTSPVVDFMFFCELIPAKAFIVSQDEFQMNFRHLTNQCVHESVDAGLGIFQNQRMSLNG
jgi:hypothetical protein